MKKQIVSTEDIEPPPSSEAQLKLWSEESLSDLSKTEIEKQPKPKVIQIRKTPPLPRFKIGPRTSVFRQRFFPSVNLTDWNDWQWQLRNRIKTLEALNTFIRLSEDEQKAMTYLAKQLPLSITPYYASLLDQNNSLQPLRRAVVPTTAEHFFSAGEAEDPLGEEHDSPVPGLVHRYPDRVLLLVTGFCSTYCRYCTRSRMVGDEHRTHFTREHLEKGIDYIKSNSKVRDVLISGGDPLTMPDEDLEWILSRLSRIEHVEFVRIGTKAPVVLPQRITPNLTRMLKRYHPIWMSIHFTHPDELTPEASQACERLADAGIPLGSQTVLLAGINDQVETMKRLMHGLLKIRVKPYYLYQCDPIQGSGHFRTPVEKGLEIISGLRGYTTGYAVPNYVIDAPGGGGKIPLMPQNVAGREENDLILTNYQGRQYRYPDPAGQLGCAD
jgi:lysine 2,3-aminomutase